MLFRGCIGLGTVDPEFFLTGWKSGPKVVVVSSEQGALSRTVETEVYQGKVSMDTPTFHLFMNILS